MSIPILNIVYSNGQKTSTSTETKWLGKVQQWTAVEASAWLQSGPAACPSWSGCIQDFGVSGRLLSFVYSAFSESFTGIRSVFMPQILRRPNILMTLMLLWSSFFKIHFRFFGLLLCFMYCFRILLFSLKRFCCLSDSYFKGIKHSLYLQESFSWINVEQNLF